MKKFEYFALNTLLIFFYCLKKINLNIYINLKPIDNFFLIFITNIFILVLSNYSEHIFNQHTAL